MMTYEKTVRTLQNNNEIIKRIHKGILDNLDPAKVYEALPDKIWGRHLHESSNG
jgi:hypothetical protein